MLKNVRIKSQLIAVMALMGVLLVGLGALGLFGMSKTNDGLKTVYDDRLVPTGQLSEIRQIMFSSRLALAMAQVTTDPDYVRSQIETIDTNRARVAKLWEAYVATTLTAEEKKLADAFAEQRTRYVKESLEPAIAGLRAREFDKVNELVLAKARPQAAKIEETLAQLVKLQLDVAQQEYRDAVARFETTRNVEIGAMVAGLLIGLAAVFFLLRGIVRPINHAVALADAVAAGDLTTRVEVDSTNETGRLLSALKSMNENLARLVGRVRSGVDTIGTASQEIAAGNADLSQRTEEQASSLEETASAMEELASTVKQNGENVNQANSLAAAATQVAIKGGEVVGEVVQTMASINDSSKRIADIIGVIDGIAFQTNILALNAAVEAARAGEQGRGFAVVASEVRTLAQRSAAAAKEIKELISDSVHRVQDGTRLVADAGETMHEIVASVQRVSAIMNDISGATQEQSSGIEQVNQAVMQMDQVTQQNAALVEQAAAAAESMREQAQALGREVAVFRVSTDAVAEAAPQEPAITTERRGADRAKNVARLPARKDSRVEAVPAEPRKTGTDGDWSEF